MASPARRTWGASSIPAQAWLPEIGMQYSRARMYSPTLGRFMQTDPVGYGAGANIYDYVLGDPVNNVDPMGLDGTPAVLVPGPNPVDKPCGAVTANVCGHRESDRSSDWIESLLSILQRDFSGGGGSISGGFGGIISGLFGGSSQYPDLPPEKFKGALQKTYCSLVPHPSGVKMVSVSGDLKVPIPKSVKSINALSGGIGVAIDPQANIAVPGFGFLGRGLGGAEGITGNYTTSNAKNLGQFGGTFAETGFLAGYGYGGGVAKFAGFEGVTGTTYSGGEVTGLQGAAGTSHTHIGPSLNLDDLGDC
jgi:RHS repeat-associated protein